LICVCFLWGRCFFDISEADVLTMTIYSAPFVNKKAVTW
jgi:hypothetical protein